MTKSFTKTLKDLGLALLNATLILLIALSVLILLVIQQANGLVDTISNAISLPELVTGREGDTLLAEAQRLRDNLASLNDDIESQTLFENSEVLTELAQQLEELTIALEGAGEECLVDMQQVAEGIVMHLQATLSPTTSE